jgi:predicted metal-dependent phosphoesterase TrpH
MHLLAYWLEPGSGPLQDRLAELREGRAMRNTKIIDSLNDLGVAVSIDDVLTAAPRMDTPGASLGRPHIAAALLRRGEVASIAEAFDKYLGAGRPAYHPRPRLEAAEAVRFAASSGAVTSVAHPHTVADDSTGFDEAFAAFSEVGITGVECHYVEYRPEQRDRLAVIAEGYGLVPTGGSDYHGDHKPGIAVGVGRGDLAVPGSALERLRAAREHI